ncbi:MAG: hypothetical protein QMD13_06270 [Candidatus Bathyarchaeia archaeon]|nr:hypothetical protein [Candidatus Bathyarchaeia archaeon]
MVTREMKARGKVVVELDYSVYKKMIGAIRSNLPSHVYISPERITKEGRKVVKLWCMYPKTGKVAVERALGVSKTP